MKKLLVGLLCALFLAAPALAAETAPTEAAHYSYAQCKEVMDAIDFEEGVAAGVMAMGIGAEHVEILIDMSHPGAAEYMEKFTEQYGDILLFQDGTGMEIVCGTGAQKPITPIANAAAEARQPLWLWPLVALLGGLAAFSFYRARTGATCRTADGTTVTAPRPLTIAAAERAVRQSHFAPREDLDRRILAEIDKM